MCDTYGIYLVDYIDQSGCRMSKSMSGNDPSDVRRRFTSIYNPYQIIRVYRVI